MDFVTVQQIVFIELVQTIETSFFHSLVAQIIYSSEACFPIELSFKKLVGLKLSV